jgi:hypothetical protein
LRDTFLRLSISTTLPVPEAGEAGAVFRRNFGADRPSMPIVGDDRDRLLVIPDEHAANNLFLLGLKPDALADLKSSI